LANLAQDISFDPAEEKAFEQRSGQSAAIDRQEKFFRLFSRLQE
jgi:hypothetical protein